MRRWVRAAISNSPAMNTLTITVLLVGLGCLMTMRRETFPQFELEIALVQVLYPGASPEEVEQGICQKVEESIQSVDGIKKITSVAAEGSGTVVVELRSDVRNVQKVVNEIRSAVDRIPSFPELAEDPEVQQITFRESAIKLAVVAPPGRTQADPLELRAVTEKVRDELLQLKTVAQVEVLDAPEYQIDIEIAESTLRKHGLSLQRVAAIVRRQNLEVPGGAIRGQGEEVLLRGKDKRLVGQEIAKLPLVTDQGGSVLSIGDIGNVHDEFRDTSFLSEVNGRPALVLDIQRTRTEDLLQMSADVQRFAADYKLPGGYQMQTWADQSVDVRDRLHLLVSNGIQGLILVFLVLAIFLDLKLAFWVAWGIPVSLLGAGGVLMLCGQTLNMLTMF